MGQPNAPSARLSGVQEVFANEVVGEEGSIGQNQSPSVRNVVSFDPSGLW